MMWLIAHMWIYLTAAFLAGMVAHRWIFGGGRGSMTENAAAELASVRTRHQEAEAERARLRSRVVELGNQLEDARREARSAQAEARTARLEAEEIVAGAKGSARAEPVVRTARAAAAGASAAVSTPPLSAPAPAPALEPEDGDAPPTDRTVSFMEMLREGGAPDDLTKIKGIGRKLEGRLNSLGVYYYRQIALWSDEEVAEMDKHLGFPGRIVRDQWREQAKALGTAPGGAA